MTESKSILLIRTFCYNLFLAATTIIFAIISWLYFRLLSPQPKLDILYRKKISISIKNTGIRQLSDQSIYPKKDGRIVCGIKLVSVCIPELNPKEAAVVKNTR